MIQEDKQLLLKDLCARLPYGVEIQVNEWTVLDTNLKTGHIDRLLNDDIRIKPYLRLMSSMTEEEREEWMNITNAQHWLIIDNLDKAIDFLNAHHFDYRGLIEKGLALEAPEDMYKTD